MSEHDPKLVRSYLGGFTNEVCAEAGIEYLRNRNPGANLAMIPDPAGRWPFAIYQLRDWGSAEDRRRDPLYHGLPDQVAAFRAGWKARGGEPGP